MPTSSISLSVEPQLLLPRVDGDREAVLRLFADRIAQRHGLSAEELYRGLTEREELGSTAIGGGVAIPHCRTKAAIDAILAVGIAEEGVDFDATDGKPVRLFFVVVSPQADPSQNLRCLAAISKWVQTDHHVKRLLAQKTCRGMADLLADLCTH